MPDREDNGNFAHGNTIGVRFGHGQKGNPGGRAKNCCASVKEYWNILTGLNLAGESKYTVEDLEKIVKAPKRDKTIPTTKRIAAREILDGLKSGQVGRKVMEFLFDRTEGKARQQIDINANMETQRVLILEGSSYLQSLKGEADKWKLAEPVSPKACVPASLRSLPAPTMPLGGIEAALAPETIEKAPEPIDTRPAPRVLPSSPGRVHGPGESEG